MKSNEIIKSFINNFKLMIEDICSKDKEKIKRQIPNILTITRGIFAPLFILISLILNSLTMSFIVILIASLTDTFDGWYARKKGYVTEFGAILDTICDKVFILCIILPIAYTSKLLFALVIVMEFLISVVNSYLKLSGKETKSSRLGKIKTIVLDLTLVISYFCLLLKFSNQIIEMFLIITIIFQIIALIGYLINLLKQVGRKRISK